MVLFRTTLFMWKGITVSEKYEVQGARRINFVHVLAIAVASQCVSLDGVGARALCGGV